MIILVTMILFCLQDEYKDIQYIVSKRSDSKIQMVLVDSDGVKSSKIAMEIKADLDKGIAIKWCACNLSLCCSLAISWLSGQFHKQTKWSQLHVL